MMKLCTADGTAHSLQAAQACLGNHRADQHQQGIQQASKDSCTYVLCPPAFTQQLQYRAAAPNDLQQHSLLRLQSQQALLLPNRQQAPGR